MLTDQKLVNALHEFISENGIDDFVLDANFRPLTRIEHVPSFLVNPMEAQRLLAHSSRVSSSESLAEASLPKDVLTWLNKDDSLPVTTLSNFFYNVKFDNIPVEEKLLPFLRTRLDYPNLTVKFAPAVRTNNLLDPYNTHGKFPFGLYSFIIGIVVTCSVPDTEGKSAPESTASASLGYLITNHPIIGPDYTTISDIEIRVPEELNADGIPKKQTTSAEIIPETFLFKAAPALSPQEKDDLADGSAHMLLSREDEMKVLATEFLCNSFFFGRFCDNGVMQHHALRSMATSITEGKLYYYGIEILAMNFSHQTDPNDSNKIEIRNVCTALVALDNDEYAEVEIVFGGTLAKTDNSKGEACYSVEKYDVQLNFKDKSVLQDLTGSSETILGFDDGGKGISHDFIGHNFSENFQKYCEIKLAEEKSAAKADSSVKNSPTTQPTSVVSQGENVEPKAQPTQSAYGKTSISEKEPSLPRRIKGMSGRIVKFISNMFSNSTFGKVRGIFSSKSYSFNASVNSDYKAPDVPVSSSKYRKLDPVEKDSSAIAEKGNVLDSNAPSTIQGNINASEHANKATTIDPSQVHDQAGHFKTSTTKRDYSVGSETQTTEAYNDQHETPSTRVKAPTITSGKASKTSTIETTR